MLVTFPQSYPLTLDPIDTYYRPTPEEIADLFRGYTVLVTKTIVSGTAASDMRNPWVDIPRVIRRALLLRGGLTATGVRLHRLAWLFRHYRISVAILQEQGLGAD